MTGRLVGNYEGRPVILEADGKQLVLHAVAGSLWSLRGLIKSPGTPPMLQTLQRSGLGLQVQFGPKLTLNVLPVPSFLVRWFLPRGVPEPHTDTTKQPRPGSDQ